MLSLYEILKASKTGLAPDLWTALAGKNWNGSDSGHEVKELTGIPPLSFRADGTLLLDFLISGNMVQSGTPSPSSIIMPSECGDKTGNLFDYQTMADGQMDRYLLPDGTTVTSAGVWAITDYIPIDGTVFTLKRTSGGNAPAICLYDANKSYITGMAYNGNMIVTLSASTTAKYARFSYLISTSNPENLSEAMLVNGTTVPSSYEPYGIKIPISSANTTTPVYLGEVESTRQIKKLVLTGQEEGWRIHQIISSWFQLVLSDAIVSGLELCTHYKPSSFAPATIQNGEILVNFDGANNRAIIRDTTYTTLDNFKAYLAQQYANGTPVTIWYVLATPQTAIVNEPIRKIGDYTDTLSMEQAGVSVPTLNGQTVVDVDTTLKPSEMYIKYKG